jgi:hypothetical protein
MSDTEQRLATAGSGTADESSRPELIARSGSPRLPADLRADCTRCVSLCCVLPPFYSVQGFGFDKPANTPCPNLTRGNRCAIHASLEASGFAGCVAFDCYGAGQHLTRLHSAAGDVSTSESAAAELSAAYSIMLTLHRSMAMLFLAAADLEPGEARVLDERRTELDALCAAPEALSGTLNVTRVEAETMALIKSMRRGGRLTSRP